MALALSAAAEMPHIGLADALELCLVLLDREPAKYERAALRWHGRYCREVPGVGLQEGQAVLALLGAIGEPNGKRAATALSDLLEQRGELKRAAEILERWGADIG